MRVKSLWHLRGAQAALTLAFCASASCSGGGGDGTGMASPGPVGGDGDPPAISAGQAIFYNTCPFPVTLLWNGSSQGQIAPTGGQLSLAISSLNQGDANVFMPYPDLSATDCPAAYCDGWTALGGVPGTMQREGYMWEGDNLGYATYCNPNLSGRGICAQQMNCCGPGMVQDGTYGTTFELTPNGGGGNDYVDLSTNYGSGPTSPPALCNGSNPDNCVSAAANIFFNLPIQWSTNQTCTFSSMGTQVTGAQCFEVSCPAAYQFPVDDKQTSCPSGSSNGYLVQFCPSGSSVPSVPGEA